MKNFSVIETSRGDFRLAPAYDLLTQFTPQYPLIEQLINASFLQSDTKKTYMAAYRERRNRLQDMT
ncbi:MAG: hypothetical protein RRY61_06370 [Bacteroidales bacterium]